jgi:glyoxylase-like metal-dependent hydrolase (beta-lactamase superfamily II)/rhodanese-related sulfurtransferase
MLFKQFQHEEGACLSYILGCTRTGGAAVIEPQLNIDQYLAYLSRYNLHLTHIFETHAQADHISGALNLHEATGAPIHYHASAQASFSVARLNDGDEIMLGNIRLNILHTPGHTSDSISIVVSDTTRSNAPWFVLTGDALFVGDVGRPDLDGDPGALYDSIFNKLLKLPDDVEIFPSHYAGSVCGKALSPKPSSTIGFERKFNLALQFKTKQEFIDFVVNDLPVQPPRFQKVRAFNLGFLKDPPIEKTFDIHALEITPQELNQTFNSGKRPFVLDVRNPDEFETANIGGYLIPLSQLPQRIGELNREQEIVVHCHTGRRSARAVEFLYESGFKNVKNLTGGIDAWSQLIDPKIPRY